MRIWNWCSHDFHRSADMNVLFILFFSSSWSQQWHPCDITHTLECILFRWIFISIKFYVFNFSRRWLFSPLSWFHFVCLCCERASSWGKSELSVALHTILCEMGTDSMVCDDRAWIAWYFIRNSKNEENAFGYLCVRVSPSANDAQKLVQKYLVKRTEKHWNKIK